MNGPHLKVRWVVAHWKHIDRERARERQTHTLQTAYICTHIYHLPPSALSPVYVCVCASISKVIQARKNFGNWKFAHKNLSPFSSCALAPALPLFPSLMAVCLWNFSLCNLPGHKYLRPALEQPSKKKKLLSGALSRRQKTSWSAWIVYVDKLGCSFFYIGAYPVISRGRRVA